MNTKTALGVFIMVVSIAVTITMIGATPNWTVEDNSVYVDDDKVYINVTPHTLIDDGEVEIELLSKVYTGNIDVMFGFNTDNAVPKYAKLYNNATEEWNSVADSFDYVNYDFQGFDKWYYAKDVPIVQDNLYRFKFYVDIGFNTTGKYWFGVKPSSETIQEAIALGHFYYIDPWWNNSYLYKFRVWFNSTATGTSQNITRHLMIDTQDLIDGGFMNDSCFDLRVVNTWENDTLKWQFEDPNNDTWGCNAVNTTMWVNIPLFNTSNYSAWVYYGEFIQTQRGIAGSDIGVWDDDVKLAMHIVNNSVGDRSSNGNHGTISGSPGFTNGTFTNSMIFDGINDRIDVSDSADFTNNIFSVSVWANVSSFNDIAPWLVGAGDEGLDSWSIRISQNTGFQPMFSGGDCLHTIPVTLTNTWFNIVSVYDGTDSDQKIWTYINGDFNLSATCSFTYTEDVGAIRMGRGQTGFSRWYDGQLDEIVYIAKNLSAQDVKRMYEQQIVSFGAQEEQAGEPPTVNITFPLNTTTREIDLDYNATVENIVDTVLMNVGGDNLTASNISTFYFNLSGTHPSLSEGSHNLTVWANNSNGITSDIVFFRIDRTIPVVALPVFVNGTSVGTFSSFGINVFVTDDQAVGDTCLVSVHGQTSNTTIAMSSSWCNGSVPTTGATGSGNISVFAWANDSANNWALNDSFVISVFPSINVSIIDEITNQPYNMSLPNETVLSIFCSDQTNRTIITDNTLIGIPTNCTIEQIRVDMDFGADLGGNIFRPLIPQSSEVNITFYMPNPINDTVLANQIEITDLTGQFDPGLMRITKIIGDARRDIIEQEIGFAGLSTIYIIKDERYGVEVQSLGGSVRRTLNELVSVTAGVITITISGISFDLNITTFSDNVLWQASLDQTTNVIQVTYVDLLQNTINTTIDIINASNISQVLFTQTDIGTNNIVATFVGITPNQSYIVNLTIYHNDFMPGPQTQTAILSYDQRLLSDIPVSANTLAMIGLIFVTVLALLFGARYASIGAIIIAVTVAFMTFVLGIFSTDILTWPVIVVLFLIAILSKLTNRGVKV